MNPFDNAPPTHRTSSPWWLVLLAVLAVALLVTGVWAKYHQRTTAAASTTVEALTPAEYDARITHPNSVFDITIEDGKLVKGPSKITVNHGASVRVTIHPIDEEANLRLEGYDIIAESSPSDDVPGSFSFVADKTGSFKFYSVSDGDSDSDSMPHELLLGEIIVQ